MKVQFPKTISGWCLWLFFVAYGLQVIPAVGGFLPAWLAAVFALAYAIFSLLGM